MMSFLNSKSFGMHLNYFLVLTILFCAAFVQFSTSSAIFSVPSDEHGEFYDVELGSQLCTGACNAVNTYNDKNNVTLLEEEIDQVEEMLYFLNLGVDKIQQYADHTDVVLFVGLTGTGKTTLLQFVANKTNRLYSEKDGFQFIIKDVGGVLGNFSLVSQTFLPNVMVDKDTGIAVWDCPGFNDNRNVSVEIANAFYIKTIADVAERIKIVAVVSHDTYESKNLIEPLFKGLTALLRNPKSYLGSISIINTKTPTGEMEQAEILETYVSYLGKFKDYIDNEFTTDVGIREAAQDILSSFLMGGSPDNKLLGYFPQPQKEKYLDEMPMFVKNKKLLDSVLERTVFVPSKEADFGYSLSSNAVLAINTLVRNITSEITDAMSVLAISTTIHLQDKSNALVLGVEVDVKSYNQTLMAVTQTNFTLIHNNPDLKPSKYVDEIVRNIGSFQLDSSELAVEKLEKAGRYLDFLSQANEANPESAIINPSEWVKALESISSNVSTYISQKIAPVADNKIELQFQSFAAEVESAFKNQVLEFLTKTDSCSNETFRNGIVGLKAADYSFALDNPNLTALEYLEQISSNIDAFGSKIGLATPPAIIELVDYLELFQSASQSHIFLRADKWVVPLKNIEQNIIKYVDEEVVSKMFESTYEGILNISTIVETQLLNKVTRIVDIKEQTSFVSLILTELEAVKTTLQSQLGNSLNISSLLRMFKDEYLTLNVTFTPQESEDFLRNVDCLDTLQILNDFSWVSKKEWLGAHDGIHTTLMKTKYFSDFLESLFQDLSSFDIQSKRLGELDTWWNISKPITFETFPDFWNKLTVANVHSIISANQTPIHEMLSSGNNLINLNLALGTVFDGTFHCPDIESGILTFEQNFLSLQHVLNCAQQTRTNQIVIKVFQTFFVDVDIAGADFDEINNLDLFVMASKWFIRDNKIINLDGLSGSGGTPGHAAGNLFAVTQGFEDGKLDFSSFNGGSGSNGKDGNDGSPGSSGSIKSFTPGSNCDAWSGGAIRITIYPNTCNTNNNGRCHAGNNGVLVDIYGTPGTAGGNGGQGTNAGAGGVHGQGYIVDVSPHGDVISKVGVNGKDGITGKGGAGGLGGKNGDTRWVQVDDVLNGNQKICKLLGSGSTSVTTRGTVGSNGNDGILVPTTRYNNPFVKEKYLTYVADYKANARKLSTSNSFLRAQLVQFLDLVDQNPNLKP